MSAHLINRFGRTLILRRSTGSYNADGIFVRDVDVESEFVGACQPLSAKDMQALPEGRGIRQSFKIYTLTELFPSEDDAGTVKKRGDVVNRDGVFYEVFSVKHYEVTPATTIHYYQANCERLEEQPL